MVLGRGEVAEQTFTIDETERRLLLASLWNTYLGTIEVNEPDLTGPDRATRLAEITGSIKALAEKLGGNPDLSTFGAYGPAAD